jgi:hypothetical protein
VLREATRSSIQTAGLSSVDLRSRGCHQHPCFEPPRAPLQRAALVRCKLLRQLRSRDIGSALRASHPEVFNR